MTLWLILLPIVLLAVVFSDFRAISPVGIFSDLADISNGWRLLLTRISIWLYLISPILIYFNTKR